MAGNFYSECKTPRYILVRVFNFQVKESTLQALREKVKISPSVMERSGKFSGGDKRVTQHHTLPQAALQVERQRADNLKQQGTRDIEQL